MKCARQAKIGSVRLHAGQAARRMLGLLVVGVFMAAGGLALAEDGWGFDVWKLGPNKACSMFRQNGGNILAIFLTRLPDGADAGMIRFAFREPALAEAAKARQTAELAFDVAALEGYRLSPAPNDMAEITITTNSLSDLFSRIDGAARLDVVLPATRVSFDLGGFEAALEQLQVCAAGS